MPMGGLIAGGLGAVGSIASSFLQSNAAKDASSAQTALGRQALAQQQQFGQQGLQTLLDMFKQAQGIAQPAIDIGKGIIGQGQDTISSVMPTLKALLTPGANMTSTLSQIPGFQFAQDWGQKAVQNIGTTTGLGGNTLKAGADYATGVAQQGWQGIVDSLLKTGGLGSNILGTGVSAMTGPTNALIGAAANTGNSAFSNLNQLGSTIGNTMTGIGNAQASGILGSANALAGGIQGATGGASNALFLSKLLGPGGGAGAGGGGGIYGSTGPGSYLMGGGSPTGYGVG